MPHTACTTPHAAASAALRWLGLMLLLATPAAAQSPGSVVGELKLSEGSGGFGGTLHDGDRFGAALAELGDLDGDGVADLAVAASHDDDGAPDAGAVWILFLQPDGSVREERKLSSATGDFGSGLDAGDLAGFALAAPGDVDGDGIGDLAVGAPGDDDGQPDAGAAWILFLQPDGSVREARKLSATTGGLPAGLSAHDGFGAALAALGDLDGDGIGDLAVGAPGTDDGVRRRTGAVWILFLQADGTVRDALAISATSGGFGGTLHPEDGLGAGLARLEPFGSDGLVVLAAGAPGDDAGAVEAGAVWLLHLLPTGSVASQTRLSAADGGLQPAAGDHLGRSLAAAGDLDGDGVGDLLAGAPGPDNDGAQEGTVRVLFLDADGSASSGLVLSSSNGGLGDVLDAGDGFGIALAGPSGAATDGPPRARVGAWGDDDGGTDRGAAWQLQLLDTPDLPAFDGPLGTLAGSAGQPTLIFPPPPGVGDDFKNEPVVIVPTTPDTVTVSQFGGGGEDIIALTSDESFPAGNHPIHAQSGHFTDDSLADLVVANNGGDSISLHVQLDTGLLGTMNFAPKVEIPLPFDDFPVALRTGDVNGDGLEDVVVAGGGGVTTVLGDGLGGLVPTDFTPVSWLSDLRLADLNDDGMLDVVTTSGRPTDAPAAEVGFATVLLGTGTGAFTAGDVFADGHPVASVLLADFDVNGTQDALLAIHERAGGPAGEPQGRIELFLGDGAGGFVPAPGPAGFVQPNADGVHPRWGEVADLDANGLPDAVYTSNDSLAFVSGTFAQEQPPLVLTTLVADGAGGFVAHTLPTNYAGKGVAPLLLDIAPEGGDGFPDCIVVWTQDLLAGTGDPAQGSSQPVTLLAAFVGDGTGAFHDASPNQFLGSEEPGDPAIDEVNELAAAEAPGGLDILIPDLADGSVKILLGDGAGGIAGTLVVPDVDPTDERALPAGGIWQGGPRTVTTADLDADGHRDLLVYSRWDDLSGLFASRAAWTSQLGDGTGAFPPSQAFLLARAGDLDAGDVDGDGRTDVCVTLLTGREADAIAVYRGLGSGQLATAPQLLPAPAGRELTGGLLLADLDGGHGAEIVTTARVADTGAGEVVVYRRELGNYVAHTYAAGGAWDAIRSLDRGDLDGDGVADLALGVADGRLFLARGLADAAFEPLATGTSAAALGGGALRLGHIDAGTRLDLVSSTMSVQGALDQAFVRVLLGTEDSSFAVSTLPGLSSVGIGGTRRPALADLDDDGTLDTVLVHGGTGTVSVLLNTLSTFTLGAPGKPGTGGLVPALSGKGYTSLGGGVTLSLVDGLPGAPGLLQIAVGPPDGEAFSGGASVIAELPIQLTDASSPTPGSWSWAVHIPDEDRFIGLPVVLRVIVADPGAGAPGEGLSLSNELAFTVVP